MRKLLLAATLVPLGGCVTDRVGTQAPQLVPAADVIRQVKYEVGKFAFDTRGVQSNANTCLSKFRLIVDKADIDLTTTTSRSASASAGAQVPINLVKLGVGGSIASGRSDTQALHLVLVPHSDDGAPTPPPHPVWAGEPLYAAMSDVYVAIIAAADQRPCVGIDEASTVSFGFSAERKTGVSGSLGLFVLSLGADRSVSGSAAHSVTLHFSAPEAVGAVPFSDPPPLPESRSDPKP